MVQFGFPTHERQIRKLERLLSAANKARKVGSWKTERMACLRYWNDILSKKLIPGTSIWEHFNTLVLGLFDLD